MYQSRSVEVSAQEYPVQKAGSREVPNPYTLKWVLPYHFRMTEKQVVHALTLAFCAPGLPVLG